MIDNLLRCKIKSYESSILLVGARLDKDIERKNAEEIVQQFKGDKYISASIRENVLEVHAKYPRIAKECARPGERVITLNYTLEKYSD